jgi:sugar phosphate permease
MYPHNTGRLRAIHYAWAILALCFVNLFISYGIRLGYSVVLPEMIRTIGITRREGGDIINAYLFTYLCLSPFTGYLTDRFGARMVISGLGVLLGLGTILMGTAANASQAAIFFAITGIGGAAMWTPVVTLAQRWFAPRRRGMALGILSTGFGLGLAVMGRLYPAVVAHWSWHYCWYLMGTAALAMVAVNGLLLRSKPDDKGLKPWGEQEGSQTAPAKSPAAPTFKERYREIFGASRFWVIGSSYFLIAGALYTTLTFIVDYARSTLGFPYERASLLATTHGFGQVFGVLVIPMLSDYIGRRWTILLTNILIAASITGILLSGGDVFWLFASVASLGAFYGVTFPMYGACGGDYFRKELMGTVIGIWTPFYGVGAIIAHRAGGQIRDITGSFDTPFLLCIAAALGAAALMLFVREPKDAQRPSGSRHS